MNANENQAKRAIRISLCRSRWGKYLLAGLLTLVTLIIRLAIGGEAEGEAVLNVFLIPIILSAYLGGLGPGVAATVFSALTADYYLLTPTHSFLISGGPEQMEWLLLIVTGGLISVLTETLHRCQLQDNTNEQQHKVTLASIGDAVITTDNRGHVTFLNGVAERLTGWTSSEAKNKPLAVVFRIIDEQTRQPVEDPIKKVLHCGSVVGLANHTILISRDGREIPIDDSGAPIKQANGAIVGVVLVFRDCTEKKKNEAALRDSMALYHSLVEQIPAGLFRKNTEGRYVFVNSLFCEFGRLKPEQYLGRTAEEFASELATGGTNVLNTERVGELSRVGGEHHALIMQTGQRIELEEERIFVDGRKQYLQVIKSPVFDSNGKIVGSQGILYDITQRKEAEAALRESEQQLQEIASSLREAVWLRDARMHRILYVNPAFERISGLTCDQFLQNPEAFSDLIHPDDKERVMAARNACFDGQSFDNEHRIVRPDGSVRWVRGQIMPVRNEAGETRRLTCVLEDITERKQAEEKLLYERELFESLLETTPDNVYFKDRESRIVRVSRSKMQGTLQIARDNYRALHPEAAPDQWPPHLAGSEPFAKWLIGKTDFDTYPEAHARAAYEDEQEIIRTGQCLAGKLEKTILPDGQSIWWLTTKMPWRDKDGNIIGTYGVSANVTAFKAVEAALNQERLLLRTLIDLLPEIFYVKDLNGRFLVANQTMAKHLGKDNHTQVLGLCDTDFFPPATAAEFRVEEEKILAGEPLIEREQQVDFPDGRKCMLLTTKVPFRDGQGKICGLVGIGRDITDRKRAEEALRQANQSLQTLSKCNEALVRAADETSLLKKICQIATEIGGYSLVWVGYLEQDAAKSVRPVAWAGAEASYAENLRVNWADTERGRGPAGTAIRTGQPATFPNLAEHPDFAPWREEALRRGFAASICLPLKADNKTFGVLCVYSSRPDAFNATETALLTELANDLAFGIATLRNRTERKQLEEQLRQSQKMDAIGQLAGGVAHDFNNMLTVIQGNASLLSNPQLNNGERSESAQQIVRAAERAASLTRQLLLFSRKQVMQAVPLNLNEVVGNMTKMLQRILGEDISLNANFASNLPVILADSGMIEQILLNLAVNSRDAMPNGGRLTITTSMETLDENQAEKNVGASPGLYACLNLTDTGCGIAPENLPRIFEPFFTTKEVGKGTGLGLATVYGIIQQHHGWIAVTSQIGQGTSFRIYLPAAKGPLPKSLAASAMSKLPGGNETILLVEDEPPVRLLASNLLQRCGYTVLVAESGAAALPVWKEHREKIHLLLTDMVMPEGISGRELAEKLKSDRPELKVIYTSGYSTDIIGREPRLIEGGNFLQKPYHPLKLAQVIRNCLDQKPTLS